MNDWQNVRVFGSPPVAEHAVIRPSAYGLLVDAADRIAVVNTPQGWFLPGGGIETGEDAIAAVVREIREECGLPVLVGSWRVRAIDFVYSVSESTHFEKQSTFVDAHVSGETRTAPEADHVLMWLELATASARLSHPSHRWAVAEFGRR